MQKNKLPKNLHNAHMAWGGGKGPDSEPPILWHKMLEMTVPAES